MRGHPLQRTCVGCRRVAEQETLIRLVATAAGDILVNPPPGSGRGAYLCPSEACLTAAWKRRVLPRALGRATPQATEAVLKARFVAELARRGIGREGAVRDRE
jgi:predicted RNA-binding protein YlxR (DUF448 family)